MKRAEEITSEEVLRFWFSDEVKPLWFRSTPEFDTTLKELFEPLWLAAAEGELNEWIGSPNSCLALIIVLDQFPLNMFRGEALSFSTGDLAAVICKQGVKKGFDEDMSDEHKMFFYMPLMHSEDLDDQDLSVDLYEKAGLESNARFARHHREIIRRFSRFPHRNEALGRLSTHMERGWLASPEAFKG